VEVVGRYGHWVAFGLLVAVGVHMIRDGLGRGEDAPDSDPERVP
jgi:putative Mn2+ efflux pump MntP